MKPEINPHDPQSELNQAAQSEPLEAASAHPYESYRLNGVIPEMSYAEARQLAWQHMRPRGSEHLAYLEHAWKTAPTVKSGHNLACYLHQSHQTQWAQEILTATLALKPVSHFPYWLQASVCMETEAWAEAEQALEQAWMRKPEPLMLLHLGYCAARQEKWESARAYFESALETGYDPESHALYNLALTEYVLGNAERSYSLAETYTARFLRGDILVSDPHEAAGLFFLLGDAPMATGCMYQGGLKVYRLPDWEVLSWLLYADDPDTWREKVQDCIYATEDTLEQLRAFPEEWGYTAEEAAVQITRELQGMERLQRLLHTGPAAPELNVRKMLMNTECPCLLFGCNTSHAPNPADDH